MTLGLITPKTEAVIFFSVKAYWLDLIRKSLDRKLFVYFLFLFTGESVF